MKIYEEVTQAKSAIIILEKGEGKHLLEALETACKANKRKKIWRKLIKQIENELPLY